MAADVGVAMGKAGTEVARDASGMILMDDDLSTLVFTVQQGQFEVIVFVYSMICTNQSNHLVVHGTLNNQIGRCIVENLRKSLIFYLACKLAMGMIFLLAMSVSTYAFLGEPLSPLQVSVSKVATILHLSNEKIFHIHFE